MEGRQPEDRFICRLNLTVMPVFCRDSRNPTPITVSRKPAGLSPVLGALLVQKDNYLVDEDEIATSFHVVALTAKCLLLQKSFI